ncbi:MAG: chemotaxis protein CheW [Oscillatoriales cyanobacterium SM2_1_8]|nr:chemotaxis protein CheW [Oscillatoriales cyanobacterium SM2_1_8]
MKLDLEPALAAGGGGTEMSSEVRRLILVALGEQTLSFADVLVAEILLVERSYILPLPFYGSAVLGVIHHQGGVVPLVSLRRALGESAAVLPERLTAVRLTELAPDGLAGMGLVVDRLVGSVSVEDLTKFPAVTYVPAASVLARLAPNLWQPQRWAA